MPLTLLFDLDDTLLDNDQNAFFAAFYTTLSASLSAHASPEQIARGMQSGIQAMFLNDDPARTLADAFFQHFQAEVPVADPQALRADVDTYYQEVYPTLSAHTLPRPAAVELMDWAFARGYRVAIMTNPVFSAFAVEERLRWAGLAPEKYDFELVTSNESFHFVKSPAYFAEVMARLGWPDEPTVVVGDDLYLDVKPARALGLAVYHVTSAPTMADVSPAIANGSGGIGALQGWLQSSDLSLFKPAPTSPEAIVATLLATPAGLAGLVAGLTPEHWMRGSGSEEWGLTEIICHLRDVDAEVNLPRVEALLRESNPFIPGQETNGWAEQRDYAHQDGRDALRQFTETRTQMVRKLSALGPQDWQRRARHSVFGPTDLRELAGISAEHDRSHIRQAFQLLPQRDRCRA
jgi:FMN phosphatase YigB (HAD superfamily)